jgi:hypothetical protein
MDLRYLSCPQPRLCLIAVLVGSFDIIRAYSAHSYVHLFFRFHFSCAAMLTHAFQACISVSIIAHVRDVWVLTLRRTVADNHKQSPPLISQSLPLLLRLCSISLCASPLLPLLQNINPSPGCRPRTMERLTALLLVLARAMADVTELEVHQLVRVVPLITTPYNLLLPPLFLLQRMKWNQSAETVL